MSGFSGILNLEDSPIDGQLLHRMAESLFFRGPDGERAWSSGEIGLAHAALRTADEPASLLQPLTLDGQVWIAADARLDGRSELAGELASHGTSALGQTSDAALILHAYLTWGEECLAHCIGDFAFAIWDARARKLFCARDRFGVKPFFFAKLGQTLIFSNTIQALRLHPAVSDRLDDQAIGDFLLFGSSHHLDRTAFADIRRLPGAHLLVAQEGSIHVRRYWSLPIDDEIGLPKAADYIDRFRSLLTEAVKDRMGSGNTGILMSGGLDSTSVAAAAGRHSDCASRSLHAFTVYCHGETPDPEYKFASLAAESLRLPISFHSPEPYMLFERWDQREIVGPEPSAEPLSASTCDWLRAVASHGRVALTGLGGDPAMLASASHAISSLLSPRFPSLLWRAGRYWRERGKLPNVGLRSELKRRMAAEKAEPSPLPAWLRPDLASKLDLEGRWRAYYQHATQSGHPLRPEAYDLLVSPQWPPLFESYDAGFTGIALEVRHPFFDLRLLRFLLSLPPIPWCVDKEILRAAMQGWLPDSVRLRPKTPLADSFLIRKMQDFLSREETLKPHPLLSRYVDTGKLQFRQPMSDDFGVWTNLVPLCLNRWLFSARIGQ